MKFSDRYKRQMLLPQIGSEGQKKILEAKVLVIGAGGLGCPLMQILASSGIGTIGIVDHDVVSQSNLHRQILFSESDIGKNKSETAAIALTKLNAEIQINVLPFKLTTENSLQLFYQYDLIIDGSDNFETKYLVNDTSVKCNKTFLSGSVNKFEGQLGLFNAELDNGKRSGTYRCLFAEPPSSDDSSNCNETGILSSTTSLMASWMAQYGLLYFSKPELVPVNQLLQLNLLKGELKTFSFARNEKEVEKIKNSLLTVIETDGSDSCVKSAKDEVKEFVPDKFETINQEYFLVDVRNQDEHSEYNIGGLLIPYDEILKNAELIPTEKKVLFYCKSGLRSFIAIQRLQAKYGYTNLYNLKGGLSYYKN